MHTGFLFLGLAHIASVVLFSVGVVLLLVWASKYLKEATLKTLGMALVGIGTVVCLLTIALHGGAWGMGHKCGPSTGMRSGMMDGMMSRHLEGKMGDEFDKAFIENMIPHHEDAVRMAEQAKQHAKHDELKRMADQIIEAQQREIEQMKQWKRQWGY